MPSKHVAKDSPLFKLIKGLTESGMQQEPDRAKMSELTNLCRSSTNLSLAFNALFTQLHKPHAEIRWSSLKLIKHLFESFEDFRIIVIDKIKQFVHLVVEVDADKPLPPPRGVATRLSHEAVKTISQWKEAYGKVYVELDLMYNYMKKVYKIDFDAALPLQQSSSLNSRQIRMRELQLEKAIEELAEKNIEIRKSLDEFWSSLNLLLPGPSQFDMPLGHGLTVEAAEIGISGTDSTFTKSSLREEGYRPGVSIVVNVPKTEKQTDVVENEDNSAVLENLRSCYLQLSKHQLPTVVGLLEKISKLGASEDVIKPTIDTKAEITKAKNSYEKLVIKWLKQKKSKTSSSDDDDDDWIDVEPTQSEAVFSADRQITEKMKTEEAKPTISNQPSTSKGIPTRLLSEIPDDSCAVDLSFTRLHSKEENIWCNRADAEDAAGTSSASAMLAEAASTRVYYFVSKEEEQKEIPVCGAPLGNGKFCPRRDKKKCPFHGSVDDPKPKQPKRDEPSTSAWSDPDLERDISAALGINLTAPVKNRRSKSGLTSLKPNTPKSRLAKKISKSADRVATDLNTRDAKRHNDRFAHSFNYSLSKKL